MLNIFLGVAIATLVGCSGLIAIRFALYRTKTTIVAALILAVEAVLLAVIVGRISSVGVFGTSAGTPWLDLEIRPLATDYVPAVVGFLAGAAIVLSGYRWTRRVSTGKMGIIGIVLLPVIVLVAATVFVLGIRVTQAEPNLQAPEEWRLFDPVTRAEASLPPGFTIEPIAPNPRFNFPTAMTMGDSGEIYVATAEGIMIVDDESGRLDRMREFAPEMPLTLGLAFDDGVLYAASEGSVIRLEDTNEDGRADASDELISDLPHFVYDSHSNNGMAFGPDGRLFMTLGGTSDHGPEDSPIAGSILVMNRDGSELSVHASGFRNPYDLDFCSDGRLFATDNGPDQFGVLVDEMTTGKLVYSPPDELNQVYEGRNYGYPDFFGYPAPWSDSEPPVSFFPKSSVATGVTCYEAESFPGMYRGNLFVTLWGSIMTRKINGHKLVRVELTETDGFVTGNVHNFANLWRPIDVLVDVDGSLLVLDSEALRIFRIRYVGDEN